MSLTLSVKQERKEKEEKVRIEIVTGDGDDLIFVDPRSSPVWLKVQKLGRFLVKVGALPYILSLYSFTDSHLSSQTPSIKQSEAGTRPQI